MMTGDTTGTTYIEGIDFVVVSEVIYAAIHSPYVKSPEELPPLVQHDWDVPREQAVAQIEKPRPNRPRRLASSYG